jgi:hypothetical protein
MSSLAGRLVPQIPSKLFSKPWNHKIRTGYRMDRHDVVELSCHFVRPLYV